jgi:hypothetical protein
VAKERSKTGAKIFRVRGIVVIMGRILLARESESQEPEKNTQLISR